MDRKIEALHHQDLISKVPVYVLPFMAGIQVCFWCRGGWLRGKDQGALWEIFPQRVEGRNTVF